jgi:glycosyltransferase involved in cell wall biosynthesis
VPVKSEGIFVHFCHAAYRRRVGRRRPSRRHWLWMVNSWLSEWWALATERFFYRRRWTDALIAVGDTVAAEVRETFPHMAGVLHVVRNGIDVENYASPPGINWRRQLGLDSWSTILLFIGGDWELKGLAVALKGLRELGRDFGLVVVGEGDTTAWMKCAVLLGVADQVRFIGRTLDPRPYFWAADVVVHPSAYETFSFVMLEAAASGLPVVTTVSTDVSLALVTQGVAAIVERTGLGVASGVKALLRQDPVDLANRAQSVAAQFSWGRAVDVLEALLREFQVSDEISSEVVGGAT